MDISYRNELVREPTSRAKSALCDLIGIFPKGGALDRLLDDKNVPATKVLEELDDLLARDGDYTRKYVDEHRGELEKFRVIVVRRVGREKADRIADKLVRQVIETGIGYRAAQSLFCRALDRSKHEWPDEGGW